MKLPFPRVTCPHSTSAATTSRPKPCPCALSLSQRPRSGETASASSKEAMPRHSLLSSRRMTKENLFGSGACTLFSHRVTYSLHDGGSHGMNLAMAGVMHPKTSCASIIWNWLSCNLGDWMTIIVSAYQRWIIRELIAGENRPQQSEGSPLCQRRGGSEGSSRTQPPRHGLVAAGDGPARLAPQLRRALPGKEHCFPAGRRVHCQVPHRLRR